METKFLIMVRLLAISFVIFSCNKEDENVSEKVPGSLTLQAIGVATGIPVTEQLPGVNMEVTGNAFIMDFFDKKSGEKLGSLTDINVTADNFEDGSMNAENYTIFRFDKDNSALVLHNFIEMTPIDEVTLNGIIQPENTIYNVIGGTGKFAGIRGGSTLDAILDMTAFANGTIGFDCTYGIKLN